MTFLLRSTASLLCIAFLISEPVIAVDSDDEGDEVASSPSSPRAKRQRTTSQDDDNDQEGSASTGSNKEALLSSFVRETDALRKDINRLEIALEETNQRALEKIEREQSHLVEVERDNNLTVLLLQEENEESIESIDAALTMLLGNHRGYTQPNSDKISRPPFIKSLLEEPDFERRKKLATITRNFVNIAGKLEPDDMLRIFRYFMDRRTDDFDTLVSVIKANIEQAKEADDLETRRGLSHFIQSFPSYYSPRTNWAQNNPPYKSRLRMASEACGYCFVLGLDLADRDKLIRHIFDWEPQRDDKAPEAEIPLKDFMVKLFQDRFTLLGLTFEKMKRIHKPFFETCSRNTEVYWDQGRREALLKSLPDDYVSQGGWDPTYEERILSVMNAQSLCYKLNLSSSEKAQVVQAIFAWQRLMEMNPYDTIPVDSILKKLFPDKHAAYLERKGKEEEDRPSREEHARHSAEQYRQFIEFIER